MIITACLVCSLVGFVIGLVTGNRLGSIRTWEIAVEIAESEAGRRRQCNATTARDAV